MTEKSLGATLENGVAFIREYGFRRFVQEVHYRLVNQYWERRLGVRTSGMVELSSLGIHNEDSIEYTPMGYHALFSVLRRIPLAVSDVSFLDYGSGKGRAIVVAATFPFRRVVGVDMSENLNRVARANIERMRHKKAGAVEVLQCNAREYEVGEEINLIYCFNAFLGDTLEQVVKNILVSHKRWPRTIYIVYFNKVHFERIIDRPEYVGIRRIHQAHYYPNYSCGIYEVGSDSRFEVDDEDSLCSG